MAQKKVDGGEVDIRITASTDDLEKNIGKSQKAVEKAAGGMAKDSGKAEGGIRKMGAAAEKAGGQIRGAGEKAKQASASFDKTGKTAKDFSKGFAQNMLGINSVMAAVAGGPVAIGSAVADMGKQAAAAFNEMAAMYRQTAQAEYALEAAARNNPYINGNAVQGLKDLANEMERTTMLDGDQILDVETRLASMGQSAEQIRKIVRTAADIDASGLMNFESAATSLSRSTFGIAGTLGRINGEIAAMSEADLRAGKAIDAIAQKVAGSAAAAMATGAGQAKLFNTEVDNLKKSIGENWENATAGARTWLTDLIAKANEALSKRNQLAGDKRDIDNGTASLRQRLNVAKDLLETYEKYSSYQGARARFAAAGLNPAGINDFIEENKKAADEQRKIIADLTVQIDQAAAAARTAAGIAASAQAAASAKAEAEDRERRAAQLLNDNANALREQLALMREKAILRGEDINSLEFEKSVLEAEEQSYWDLLKTSEGLITGRSQREQERYARIQREWENYRVRAKQAEEDEKALREQERADKKKASDDEKYAERIKEAAENFKQAHADVLALTTDTVTMVNETAVTSALNAFKQLDDGAKELLVEEGKHIKDLASEISLISGDGSLLGNLISSWKEAGRIIEADWKTALGDMDAATRSAVQGLITAFDNFATRISSTWTDLSGAYGEYQKAAEDERIANAQNEIEAERRADKERLENGLMTNEELEKAEEGRAQRERQLKHETALAEYKLALNQWQNSLISATVQGSLATLKAFSEGGPYAGPILAAMIAITTGLQIATISKTRPKAPAFHGGGIVRGEGEIETRLLGGEVVETRQQFQNQMAIQARLAAAMARGGSSTGVSVNIENYGAAVSDPEIDGNNIKLTIAKTVNELMSNGGLESGMAGRNRYVSGVQLETA
jgi:hypothetical protein